MSGKGLQESLIAYIASSTYDNALSDRLTFLNNPIPSRPIVKEVDFRSLAVRKSSSSSFYKMIGNLLMLTNFDDCEHTERNYGIPASSEAFRGENFPIFSADAIIPGLWNERFRCPNLNMTLPYSDFFSSSVQIIQSSPKSLVIIAMNYR